MFFTLNEEIKIRSGKKLRDAVHDIVTTLEKDEYFDLGTISNILRHEYNLFLTPLLLERLLTLWENDKDSIFAGSDEAWLHWDSDDKTVENNMKRTKKRGVLGKARRRIKREEEKEFYKSVREDGWIRLRDGRFVYKGTTSFKVTDEDKISITKYEKEQYGKNENPIVPELVKNIFVLNHPREADEISNKVQNAIKMGDIVAEPKNGDEYYDECFNFMMEVAKIEELDTKRGWEKKYAPSKLKERYIRREKRIAHEKEQERLSLKTRITDREKSLKELGEIIDFDKKYYVIITKYNSTKKRFYIKKLLYGYINISEEPYKDGFYKIVIRKEKGGEDILFFNTFMHFKKCIESGLKGTEQHVFNILNDDDIKKLKIYFSELKRYSGWDEFLDKEMVDKIKNDF